MAAPTPTPTHSAPPSTSPAPPTTSATTLTSSEMFPPTAAYATFMHSVLSEMLHELKAVRKELQDIRRNQPSQSTPSANRKRKRPGPTPPCTLCRLSRTPCIAVHANEACQRCIRKQVDCFDDSDGSDQPRVRHPPEDDAADDAESDPEVESAAPSAPPAPAWQQPTPNGVPAGYPAAPNYPPTPVKRERVTKACADCHARKRKCTGGPNCGSRQAASSNRPSPNKLPGSTPTSRAREPCAECRGRKRRCIHTDGTPNGTNNPAEERDELEPMDDVPPTDTEPEPERERPLVDPSPPHSHSRSPPPGTAPTPATTDPNLPPSTTKSTTPAPAQAPAPPAGRKGRACLACRKLKMRCVAPNEEGGPDERCQRCERAGLECVYVDRKRRGPGGVFTGQEGANGYKDSTPGFAPPENQAPVFDDGRSAKKLKTEGSPSSYPNGTAPNSNGTRREEDGVRTQQDAARALEESFVDEEGSER
ncbi:hypothetical protein OPQ81_010744 [Rhizoctonia solani]|nr:hypothetical protein OPQ81_010744 [Rhizoctonia solani]